MDIPLILKEITSTKSSSKLLNIKTRNSYRYYRCLNFYQTNKLLLQRRLTWTWYCDGYRDLRSRPFLQWFIQSQIHLLKEFCMNDLLEHDVYKIVNISHPYYLVSFPSYFCVSTSFSKFIHLKCQALWFSLLLYQT